MVIRSLDVNKDPFYPYENDEVSLGPKVLYLNVIWTLMYFANT